MAMSIFDQKKLSAWRLGKKTNPIGDQVEVLSRKFDIDPSNTLKYIKNLPPLKSFVPRDALRWTRYYAILNFYEKAQRLFFLRKTLALIESMRMAEIKIKDRLDLNHLRLTNKRTKNFIRILGKQEKSSILVIAAQPAMRYRACSANSVDEKLAPNEFLLDSLAVSSILLTHPNWFKTSDQIAIGCCDEFCQDSSLKFSDILVFSCVSNLSGIRLSEYFRGTISANLGLASGFIPKP